MLHLSEQELVARSGGSPAMRAVLATREDPKSDIKFEALALDEAEADLEDLEESSQSSSGPLHGHLEDPEPTAGAIANEFRLFGKLAFPAVVIQLCYMLQFTYTSTYTGLHYGTASLAGFSLANLSGNLVVISLVMGFLSAAETLTPQAYSLKHYPEVGQICTRSFFLCLVLLTPVGPLIKYIDQVLVFLGQPEESARLAQEFLSIYAFGYPALVFNECALRFYRAQNVTVPFIFIYLAVLFLHPVYVHLFAEEMGYGFNGLPMAHVASMTTLSLLIILLFLYGDQHHPLTFPQAMTFEFWRKVLFDKSGAWLVLRLGLPGIMSNSEWWFWELVCFVCGQAGTVGLAAHTIAYSLIPLSFMVPLGFCIGLSSQIGQLLAVGKVRVAKKVSTIAVLACCSIVAINSIVAYSLRDHIISAFTSDPEVIELANTIWPWVCFFFNMDAQLGVFMGLIRALSLQYAMSWAVLVSLWIIGIPFIFYMFKYLDLGILGVWEAMPAIYLLLDSLLLLAVVRKDWYAYTKTISERFAAASEKTTPAPASPSQV
mmetsp:Transcript_14267/g.27697  ORF Transcript_14267/g.27697 Transcript_14267/m.27697 type:complete len:544 (-) Transcript_14267:484-2115(-)